MRVPDADLHGQHLRGGVVLQEEGEIAQRGHQEAGLVSMETQLQEAVAFSQRGASGGAGPALQASPHLRVVEAPGGRRVHVPASCEGRRGRLSLAGELASRATTVDSLNTPDIKIHPT